VIGRIFSFLALSMVGILDWLHVDIWLFMSFYGRSCRFGRAATVHIGLGSSEVPNTRMLSSFHVAFPRNVTQHFCFVDQVGDCISALPNQAHKSAKHHNTPQTACRMIEFFYSRCYTPLLSIQRTNHTSGLGTNSARLVSAHGFHSPNSWKEESFYYCSRLQELSQTSLQNESNFQR